MSSNLNPIKTHIVELQYPFLQKPRQCFDPSKGFEYTTQFTAVAADEETVELCMAIENALVEAHGKARRHASALPFNDHEGNNIIFRAKRRAAWKDGSPAPSPIIVDSEKNPWPEDKPIGNGTKAVLMLKPIPWKAGGTGVGLSLSPEVVMVMEYVPRAETDPKAMLDLF